MIASTSSAWPLPSTPAMPSTSPAWMLSVTSSSTARPSGERTVSPSTASTTSSRTVDSRVSGDGSSPPTISSASRRAVTSPGSTVATVVPRRITVISSATASTSSSLCEMNSTVMPSDLSSRRLREQLVDLLRDQHRGRLVQDEDAGAAVEHLEDLDALPVADAELLDQPVGLHAQPVRVGDLLDPAGGGAGVEPAEGARLRAEHHVLQDGQVVGQHEVLVDHADAGGDRLGRGVEADLPPVDGDGALVRLLHAVEDLHQGRLAGAVLPDDGVHRAGPHDDLDVGVGHHAGEALGYAAQLDGRCAGRGRGLPGGRCGHHRSSFRDGRDPGGRYRVAPGSGPGPRRVRRPALGTLMVPSTICFFRSSSWVLMSSTLPPEVA